jgi:1-phosphatidylinositol-4-phosphate 5-kinase
LNALKGIFFGSAVAVSQAFASMSAPGALGESGSFFFYSHDGAFMIKTQSKAESKFLRRILAHYYQHVLTHPYTYLTKFYGMHRIKMPHLRKTL